MPDSTSPDQTGGSVGSPENPFSALFPISKQASQAAFNDVLILANIRETIERFNDSNPEIVKGLSAIADKIREKDIELHGEYEEDEPGPADAFLTGAACAFAMLEAQAGMKNIRLPGFKISFVRNYLDRKAAQLLRQQGMSQEMTGNPEWTSLQLLEREIAPDIEKYIGTDPRSYPFQGFQMAYFLYREGISNPNNFRAAQVLERKVSRKTQLLN